jgi:hypothetical protein
MQGARVGSGPPLPLRGKERIEGGLSTGGVQPLGAQHNPWKGPCSSPCPEGQRSRAPARAPNKQKGSGMVLVLRADWVAKVISRSSSERLSPKPKTASFPGSKTGFWDRLGVFPMHGPPLPLWGKEGIEGGLSTGCAALHPWLHPSAPPGQEGGKKLGLIALPLRGRGEGRTGAGQRHREVLWAAMGYPGRTARRCSIPQRIQKASLPAPVGFSAALSAPTGRRNVATGGAQPLGAQRNPW